MPNIVGKNVSISAKKIGKVADERVEINLRAPEILVVVQLKTSGGILAANADSKIVGKIGSVSLEAAYGRIGSAGTRFRLNSAPKKCWIIGREEQ